MTGSEFRERCDFVATMARRLHEAGTTAPRLEAALLGISRKLEIGCEVWSSPTAIILSFRLPEDPGGAQRTEVLRLSPGDIDLGRLALVDDIAERVIDGELNVHTGAETLRRLGELPPPPPWQALLGFSLASGGVAGIMEAAWIEILVAMSLGLILAVLAWRAQYSRRLAPSVEPLGAFLVAISAAAFAHYLSPIAVQLVVLAGIIVLLPGLSLTSAAIEIATGHLVSGTARLAGATATLLKLAFGTLVAAQLARLLGWDLAPGGLSAAPEWVLYPALLGATISFALLFRVQRRDFPIAIGAALLGFYASRFGSAQFGAEFGVFVAGFLVGVASNAYARWLGRPGAIVRVPGIILLVPGSVGFKSLSFVFERDVFLGLDSAFQLLILLVCLSAGLLFASTFISPRRAL